MIDKNLQLVFALREKKEKVLEKIKEIDETKTPLQAELSLLELELFDAQERVLEEMESKNVKTYTYGENNVTAAIRRTLGIVDEDKVKSFITSKTSKIAKTIGLTAKEIKEKSFVQMLNKSFVKEIADSWLKVEGSPMQGTELKETHYLTIK